MRAAPRNSGTRNTRILAIDVSNSAKQEPADRKLGEIGRKPQRQCAHARVGWRDAPGREDAGDQRHVEKKLELRGEIDHREVAA